MPRAIFPCLTIVAAFHLLAGVAAAQVSEDVPVPQLIEGLARGFGLDPARTPALFVPDLARVVYARAPGEEQQRPPRMSTERTAAAATSVIVPVPLTLDFWSRTIFERPLRREDLLIAITADSRAALLAHGLAGLDDRTLTYLAGERALARRLYDRAAAAFGAFGESIRVDQGRVQVPGGPEAVALWESLLKQRVTRPDLFILALFEREDGRLAYLYDLIARLDEPGRAFVLGLWLDDTSRQLRFPVLVNAVVHAYQEWRVQDAPLSRPVADLSMLVARLRLGKNGAPDVPNTRAFWAAVFATDDVTSAAPGQAELAAAGGPPLDAAWLVEVTGSLSSIVRGDRLDQMAFVYRVFKDAPPASQADMIVAARGFRRHRALLMAFERIGTRAPATFATAVRQSARLVERDSDNAFWMHAEMQGTLTLIVQMAVTGGLDARTAEALAVSLCALFDTGPRATAGMAQWLNDRLLPLLPDAPDVETRVSIALAGRRHGPPVRVQWEGESYRVDLVAAELARLGKVRTRQASFTLDLALALEDVRRLVDRGRPADFQAASIALTSIHERFASVIGRPTPTAAARGVVPIADLGARIRTLSSDLSAAAAGRNLNRLEAVKTQVANTATAVLGEALLSMAYAVHLGDPDGTALLGRNVALRHDFGLTHLGSEMRERLPWSLPVQTLQPGVAWHVTGSLVGLDLALAPLALRRINLEPLDPPRLSTGERDAFALSVALMDPARLKDQDRDAIAAAIARGRERVASATSSTSTAEGLVQVMDTLRIDARRRRAILWTAASDRGSVPTFFSMAELLSLGGIPAGVDVDAWGASALATTGCLCTAVMGVEGWRRIESRPLAGLLASAVSDLNLRIAVELAAFDLPAALAHEVLSAAMLEFTDTVAPSDSQDWLALSRAAQALSRRRIEDYVAATTAVGGALVPGAAAPAPQQ